MRRGMHPLAVLEQCETVDAGFLEQHAQRHTGPLAARHEPVRLTGGEIQRRRLVQRQAVAGADRPRSRPPGGRRGARQLPRQREPEPRALAPARGVAHLEVESPPEQGRGSRPQHACNRPSPPGHPHPSCGDPAPLRRTRAARQHREFSTHRFGVSFALNDVSRTTFWCYGCSEWSLRTRSAGWSISCW